MPAWIGSLVVHGLLTLLFAGVTWHTLGRPDAVQAELGELSSGDLDQAGEPPLGIQAPGPVTPTERVEAAPRVPTIALAGESGSLVSPASVSRGLPQGERITVPGGGRGDGSFRGLLRGLRRRGVDIVFVFDSTGSMGPAIREVRRRLDAIMDTLFELVPSAQIGLVTYRDRGEEEAYVTKFTPLTRDRDRVRTWLARIEADGGGDWREAVLAGLAVANRNPWRPGAKKVIVLFGDAPPHVKEQRACEQLAARFRQQGGIISAVQIPSGALGFGADKESDRDLRRALTRITNAGGGETVPMGKEAEIVHHLLTLVFGSRWRSNVVKEYEARLRRGRSGSD